MRERDVNWEPDRVSRSVRTCGTVPTYVSEIDWVLAPAYHDLGPEQGAVEG